MVEPVIEQNKQARDSRQFLVRGPEQVQGERSLVGTTLNILGSLAKSAGYFWWSVSPVVQPSTDAAEICPRARSQFS